MWAEAQRTKITEIVALHRDAVSTVWQIACTLQKVYVRTKSRRRSRGALQLIQLSPTSHGSSRPHLTDGFLNGKSGLPFPDVIDLSGFQTTLCVRRLCRANLVQLQASLVRTGFLLAFTRTGPDCQLCFRERIHRTESVKNNSGAFVGCGSHPHSWARRELVDAIVTRRRPDE